MTFELCSQITMVNFYINKHLKKINVIYVLKFIYLCFSYTFIIPNSNNNNDKSIIKIKRIKKKKNINVANLYKFGGLQKDGRKWIISLDNSKIILENSLLDKSHYLILNLSSIAF